ncbi:MAG TPA: hypothetical protein VFW23_01695, partial [Tepidisphaeraceae bacterium]|nr:hypothetical protein [Tepidisphaeraceae bacterium]
MLNFIDVDWDKHLIANDLHKMFVLFWEECLCESTPDTWQTRTSNIKSVLHEIIEAVDVAREHEKYKHN